MATSVAGGGRPTTSLYSESISANSTNNKLTSTAIRRMFLCRRQVENRAFVARIAFLANGVFLFVILVQAIPIFH